MTQDFTGFRPSKLWKQMSSDRRVAAAELFWADDQSTEQQLEAVAALAAHMKFRAKSVIGLPLEKKAKYLSTLPVISDAVAARALVNYHLANAMGKLKVDNKMAATKVKIHMKKAVVGDTYWIFVKRL